MNQAILLAEKQHLANLLEAIQRCVYYLHASSLKVNWPLNGHFLETRKMDSDFFESLAAMNERFAKLQDVLGAAMKHAYILQGESADAFLRVLSAYEKLGVLDDIASWQLCRAARNLSAHDYETEYQETAQHFNSLYELRPFLYRTAQRFVAHCKAVLGITPTHPDFEAAFQNIVDTA
jgi:hypothetical protein